MVFLAFNIYLAYLAFPLTSLGIVISIYQRSKTALERLSPLDEEPPQTAKKDLQRSQSVGEGLLEIKQLSFGFGTEKRRYLGHSAL